MGTYAERATPTHIVHGEDNVVNTLLQIISNAKYKIDACVDYTRPYLAIEIKQLRDGFVNAKKRGIKVRYLTEIDKGNLHYCRQLLPMVNEFRHLSGIKGNFYVSDEEYGAPATFHEKGKSAEVMIYSSIKEIVEHQQYIFESIWNTSTSADRKIKEIESEGDLSSGITQIIDHPLRTKELFLNLIKSAKHEILLILPTVNAFIREYNIGAIQLLKELSCSDIIQDKKTSPASSTQNLQQGGTRERAMSIRIITPTNDAVNKILNDMNLVTPSMRGDEEAAESVVFSSSSSYHSSYTRKNKNKNDNSILQLRHPESLPKYNVTTATILVVDRKASLVFEKIDDAKESFVEAVGLSTFSTSEPTIMSYLSIFENFWNQVELYEKLKEHDKLQKEFINIASHELRTPTQAILGYSTLVRRHPEMREEMLGYIERNAIRLQNLINNILDVSRIESRTLKLNKEKFNINEKIRNVIDDIKSKEDKIDIIFDNPKIDPIVVEADKLRIYEVISNLLVNAVKFTKKKCMDGHSSNRSDGIGVGTDMASSIIVASAVKSNQSYDKDNTSNTTAGARIDEVIVSIKDRGTGIDPDVQDKLFSKFVTKSHTGSGLGLYISKGIVEAHGGKIWAENNTDGGGATFAFSLPVSQRSGLLVQ
ncbi:MAG: ATP-binding protein [Nitrososphaeraceae archaeon]